MQFAYPPGATPLTEEDKKGLIPSLSTQRELNEFEQLNIEAAVLWAGTSKKIQSGLLTVEGLQALHRKMFDKTWRWAGKFRQHDTNIGDTWTIIPTLVKQLLDDVKYWIQHSTYPGEEIVVRFHHRLVKVHPFPNGNGRHSRLAADLLAGSLGANQPTWGAGGAIGSASPLRDEYLASLREADGGNFKRITRFAYS